MSSLYFLTQITDLPSFYYLYYIFSANDSYNDYVSCLEYLHCSSYLMYIFMPPPLDDGVIKFYP